LEFSSVDFQQQTPMYQYWFLGIKALLLKCYTESENRTRVTVVRGERSHRYATHASHGHTFGRHAVKGNGISLYRMNHSLEKI
jgi:hypothetical protein